MSSVSVNVGTYCEVKADYDGITLAVTATVCPAGSVQLQADWEQTDDTSADFIKNKPTLDDTVTETSQNAVKSSGIWTAINNLWQSFSEALSNVSDSISNHINAQNDAHPAKAITVSAPVTPDYTAPNVGDTMQDITNKVAGLQEALVDLTTTELVSLIDITKDKNGKALNIVEGEMLFIRLTIPYFQYLGDRINYRADMRVNGQSGDNDYLYNGGGTTYNRFFLTGSSRPSMTSLIWLYVLNNKIHVISKTNWADSSSTDNYYSLTNFSANSITALRFIALSNREIGIGTNIHIRKL